MKYTDEEIIKQFSSADLDPQGKKQAEIYRKITAKQTADAFKGKRILALSAALGAAVLALVFVMPDMLTDNIKSKSAGQIQTVGAVSELQQFPAADTDIAVELSPQDAPVFSNPMNYIVSRESQDGGTRDCSDMTYYEPQATAVKDDASDYYAPASLPVAKEEMKAEGLASSDMQGGAFASRASAKPFHGSGKSKNIALIIVPDSHSYNAEDNESYTKYEENPFKLVKSDPLSTFSADVDTASYTIAKRNISQGTMPTTDSVRIEEFINYFKYSYAKPHEGKPVAVDIQYSDCPWRKETRLVKIGIKAKDLDINKVPKSNLVFLIDISGSMEEDNRLPLLQKAFKILLSNLRESDRVSLVTYADGTNVVLDGEKVKNAKKIEDAIDHLSAGGGTSGSAGLQEAYRLAKKNFIKGGNNRVILATDGDFNVGPSSTSELEEQITKAKETGVFLSVIGVGMGNYKDDMVQTLANKGNGNYAYVNNLMEAEKVFSKEFKGTLFTVAKDVKFQVEFNPEKIASYRLIGYEKRKLNNEDFNDDAKDAGEVGAGQNVTVLYEVIPTGVKSSFMPAGSDLKYSARKGTDSDDILTVRVRYKDPNGKESKLMESSITAESYVPFAQASDDFRFASSVAAFGQVLKESKYKGNIALSQIIKIAKGSKGADEDAARAEFTQIVSLAITIRPEQKDISDMLDD
jgi:Ca-activated chloride channel family protein